MMINFSVNGQKCETEERIVSSNYILRVAGYDTEQYELFEHYNIGGKSYLEKSGKKIWLKEEDSYYARLKDLFVGPKIPF